MTVNLTRIYTRLGDGGETHLGDMTRVPKTHPRIEAYGTVDEASSALGLAKALTTDARVREVCEELQRGLYRLGAELATNPEQEGRFGRLTAPDVERLEAITSELEAVAPMPREFVLPGATPASAALDVARTVVRRAERRAISLAAAADDVSSDARAWLNRLSLVLFVLARYEEARSGAAAPPAKGGSPGQA